MLAQTIPRAIADLFYTCDTVLHFEKGEHIFSEGEQATAIYLLEAGLVQINKETEQAKELTIRLCSKGNIIGESLLFSSMTQHTTTAKVLTQTRAYAMTTERFEQQLITQPDLMLDYVKWVQTENTKQQSRLRDLLLHGKKGALYSTLIRLANTYGKRQPDTSIAITIHLTNTDIANLCGTSRELINRLLNDLRKQQIITIRNGYITIVNIAFLKRQIACENCPLSICRID